MASPRFSPAARTASGGAFASHVGSKFWAPHPTQAFVEATLEEVLDSGNVRVQAAGGDKLTCKFSELFPRTEKHDVYPNMDLLSDLNMAEVLANLDRLYGRQQGERPGSGWSQIYASVGPVLIAMNPFKVLPLYGKEWVQAFRREGDLGKIDSVWQRLGPHCYGTVEQAYQGLRHARTQSVVICGESGAGKTVTNRKMIEYLLDAEALGSGGRSAAGGAEGDKRKEQIAEANAFLEYFGNAKTLRNDNSSRFGKYSQLHFEEAPGSEQSTSFSGVVRGFDVKHYLLERSRVVHEPPGERNYHVFHHLLQSEKRRLYGLEEGPTGFRYTRAGADVQTSFDSEEANFEALCGSLEKFGLNEDAQRSVFEAIAAVLQLGNVGFEERSGAAQVTADSRAALEAACGLLGLDAGALGRALVTQVLTLKKEKVVKSLGTAAAEALRDAVAKIVYARVFDGLVGCIAERLSGGADGASSTKTLGLLDIFGFEDMPVNGLEQMYINLTNERIQLIFNTVMFQNEKRIYDSEGIDILGAFETPPSNEPCVNLFTAGGSIGTAPGIISLLADVVRSNGQDGSHFVSRLNRELKDHPFFNVCEAQRMREVNAARRAKWPSAEKLEYADCFQVRHYAGDVVYAVRDFVAKSRDSLFQHVEEVLLASTKPYVRELFGHKAAASGKEATATVGEKFREQLKELAEKLEPDADSSGNLFVRCLKPNPAMKPGTFNRPLVLEQLICGGVVAALEIRKYGFPDRMEYRAFSDEFLPLAVRLRLGPKDKKPALPPRELSLEVLRGFAPDDGRHACGTTRVFMRSGVLADLRSTQAWVRTDASRRFQRRYRQYKGTQLIHSIELLKEDFDAALEDASAAGVAEAPPVERLAGQIRSGIDAIWGALESARRKHGDGKAAIPKVAADMGKHVEDGTRLQRSVANLKDVVRGTAARKEQAEQVLADALGELKSEAGALLSRVGELQEQALQGCGGPEAAPEAATKEEECRTAKEEECRTACEKARAQLESLFQELPRLQAEGPAGLDLSAKGPYAPPPGGPCPRAKQLLAEARGLAREAEAKAAAAGELRRAWERQISGLRLQHAQLRARLEALQPQAQEAVSENFTGVSEALSAAWQQEEELDRLLHTSRDADAIRQAVVKLKELADEAQGAVEVAKSFRQKRVKVEEAQLRRALAGLDGDGGLRRSGAAFLLELAAAQRSLEEKEGASQAHAVLLEELRGVDERLRALGLAEAREAGPRGSVVDSFTSVPTAEWMWGDCILGQGLARWNPLRWSSMLRQQTLPEVLAELQRVQGRDLERPVVLKVPAGVLSPEQRFESVAAAIDALEGRGGSTATAWSMACTHRLPDDWAERGGAYEVLRGAPVLGEEVCSSISLAVDSLNEGVIRCDEGFCVVYSASQACHYLVFRPKRKDELYEALGLA